MRRIHADPGMFFLAGGNQEKTLIPGIIGHRKVSLVQRPDALGIYEDRWLTFKKAGLPVVPTLRKDLQGNIYLTDLKADGSELYGKGLRIELSRGSRFRPRPEIDEIFVALRASDEFAKVKEAVEACIEVASENHILLPSDDPMELLLHPNGTWEIIILDLIQGRVASDYVSHQMIRRSNLGLGVIFMQELGLINKKLQTGK